MSVIKTLSEENVISKDKAQKLVSRRPEGRFLKHILKESQKNLDKLVTLVCTENQTEEGKVTFIVL